MKHVFIIPIFLILFACTDDSAKSSNGQLSSKIEADPSSENELKKEWFNENDNIGICGATSTPQWQMEEIKETILAL